MMDSRMLKEGQDFSELQDSYMIFITRTDIFGQGIPVYMINRRFERTNELFEDGSHIIYINGAYRGDDAIGNRIHDFSCKEAKDMYYPELAEGMKHFKEEGGRKYMCEAVQNYAEKYAEQRAEIARLNGLLDAVKNLMESMKWSAEQAMAALKISDADKDVLLKEL